VIAHDRDGFDVAERQSISPQPWPEAPSQFVLIDLDGKGRKHDRNGGENDQHYPCRQPLAAEPDQKSVERGSRETDRDDKDTVLGMTIQND
jgi:hypothetical protein